MTMRPPPKKPTPAPAPTRKPADYGIVPPAVKLAREREAAKMDAEKRAAEAKAMAETAAKMDAQKRAAEADAELVAKGAGTTPTPVKPATFTRTPPNPVLGGIRAGSDPTKATPVKPAPTPVKPTTFTRTPTPLPGPSGGLGATIQSADFSGINGGPTQSVPMKKGGRVKVKAKSKSSYSSGGKVSSASKRGDGCAQRGKTKGRMI